jgi:hypothetical protein
VATSKESRREALRAEIRLTEKDRRRAIEWWKVKGVVDDRGRITDEWRVIVGRAFPDVTTRARSVCAEPGCPNVAVQRARASENRG